MTASVAFLQAVKEAIRGSDRAGALNFLRNFKEANDGDALAAPATVSTKVFADTRTLAASATENLDLSGVLSALDGTTMALTKVHGIYVKASAGNTNKVVVGGTVTNTMVGMFGDASDAISVGPGDEFLFTSKVGVTITAATADLLKMTNSASGSAVSYDIVIIGA